ncbi:type VI secretion system tube protein Hcp [uncultured Roseovarius sp.]|uniref:Hcp family type VI secretion system effector n=1 Tax=uncultured Roseovarius sp. TaxID=293344 RepID=UPI00262E59E6|nr:type VI secretion system tube protein Hcp [uncultured Roseovarius sp.]
MPIKGFLTIPNIPGESKDANHPDAIDVHGLEWGVTRKVKGARAGRPKGRAMVSPLEVHKFYDAASPYLALAVMQGKAFDQIVLKVHHATSGRSHLDYLKITMTNCTLKTYHMFNDGQDDPLEVISERVEISFENIGILYIETDGNNNAGTEHEIEFDITAGV